MTAMEGVEDYPRKPDGKWIVSFRVPSGNVDVYVMSTPVERSRLTYSPSNDQVETSTGQQRLLFRIQPAIVGRPYSTVLQAEHLRNYFF
jgi:hypothetical protein